MRLIAAGLTPRVAVADFPLSTAVTVCDPALVAVQAAPVHEPSGVMVKVVAAVARPRSLPYWSNPSVA